MNRTHDFFAATLPVACLGLTLGGVTVDASASGLVASIDKAPVIADGDVQGMPTDYVITFEGSLAPDVTGRSLAAGDVILSLIHI